MPRNSVDVKTAKIITLGGKSVKKITDAAGRILWEKTSPHIPYTRIMFSAAFNSGSEFFLPLKSNN